MTLAAEGETGTTKPTLFPVVGAKSRFLVADVIVAGVISAMLIAAFVIHTRWMIPNHDNEWYLIAAARMLAGGRYITDYMEPNPPLIMLLMVPPVVVAQVAHLDPYAVFTVYVCLLIAASVLLAAPALRWLFAGDATNRRVALLCYAAILSLSPSYQFGQREHLFVILFCPGLFWFAAREAGRRSPIAAAWVVIVLAAVAALIKPFYLFVPAALLVFRGLRQRNWRVAIDAPVVVVLAVTLLYGAVILLAFPNYLAEAAIQRQVYFGWDRAWRTVLGASRDAATVLGLAIVLTELAPVSTVTRRFLRPLCVAAAACLVLGVAQKKGWPYQLLPSVEIAGFAVVFGLVMLRAAGFERRRWGPTVVVLAAVVLQLGFLAVEPWQEATALTRSRVRSEPLIGALRQMAPARSVLLLTSGYQKGFPSMTGARLAGRAPSQLLLPGIVKLAHGSSAQQARAAVLRQVAVHELVEDLRHDRPDFVAVDRGAVKQGLPEGFDMLGFYDSDPAFAEAWRRYRLARSVPGWDIYARVPAGGSGSGPTATP